MPEDGAVGTITLVDGPDTREEHGTIRAFQDDQGQQRWEILTPGEPLLITAVGFLPEHVIEFVAD